MALFKRAEDGSVRLCGSKHAGKTVDEVAREDPKYLRWAWRDCTVGLPLDVYEEIEMTMKVNGVPFMESKKKKP